MRLGQRSAQGPPLLLKLTGTQERHRSFARRVISMTTQGTRTPFFRAGDASG
jgi:hypothetical protein